MKSFLLGSLLVAALVGFWGYIIHYTPPNMDEYGYYHNISCLNFPESVHHEFREPCNGEYNLEVFGKSLPLRAYHYIGFSSSLFYSPLYAIFPHYLSARYLGLIALVLFIIGVWAFTKADWRIILGIIGLNFPLAYQMINDTGPVGFQTVLLIWLPVLFALALKSSKKMGLLLAFMIGILVFLGVEQKPFFICFFPAVLLVGFWFSRNVLFKKKALPILFVSIGVAFILSLILFTAKTSQGVSYLAWGTSKVSGVIGDMVHDRSAKLSVFNLLREQVSQINLLKTYFLNFPNFSHRHFDYFDNTGIIPTAVFWVLSFMSLFLFYRNESNRGVRRDNSILIIAAFVALALITGSKKAGAGHHFVFFFPYFLVALVFGLNSLRRKNALVFRILITLIVGSNLVFLGFLKSKPPSEYATWDKIEMLEFLNSEFASESVIVHLDWGTYYIDSLYGPKDQLVTWLEPVDAKDDLEKDLEKIKKLANHKNRTIVFVRKKETGSDWSLVQKTFKTLKRVYPEHVHNDGSAWEVWLAVD